MLCIPYEFTGLFEQGMGAFTSESIGANLDKKLTMPRIVSSSALSLGGSMSLTAVILAGSGMTPSFVMQYPK